MRISLFLKTLVLFAVLSTSFGTYAQNVGINTTGTSPSGHALLDLNTGNTSFNTANGDRGILMPQISLASTTDVSDFPTGTYGALPTGLTIYNTNAGMTGGWVGYWYWNGAKWVALLNNSVLGGGWQLVGNAGTTAGTNFLGTTDAQDMVFKANNTEWARILQGGNLKVTQNTTITLGNAQLSSGGNYMHLATNTWFNGTAWQFPVANQAGALMQMAGNTIYFYTHNGAGTFTPTATILGSDGYVGIGSIAAAQAPTAPLDVYNTATIGIRYTKNAADARIDIADPTQAWSWSVGWATGGDFSLIQEGISGDVLYAKHSNQYVGVNTSSPICRFQVNDNGDVPYILANTTSTTNKRTRIQFGYNGTIAWEWGTDLAFNNTDNLYLYDRLTGTMPIVALSNGNVGIGATNPTQQFSVGSGNQFQVNTSGNLVTVNNVPYNWPAAQGAANSDLQNDGAGNLSWSTVPPNGWVKMYDVQLTNAPNYTASPLNGNVNKMYMVIISGYFNCNPSGTNRVITIEPNGDATAADYSYSMTSYWQYYGGYSWNYTAENLGGMYITGAGINGYMFTNTTMMASTGNFRNSTSTQSYQTPGNQNGSIIITSGAWQNTATNITNLLLNWGGGLFTGRVVIYSLQ